MHFSDMTYNYNNFTLEFKFELPVCMERPLNIPYTVPVMNTYLYNNV